MSSKTLGDYLSQKGGKRSVVGKVFQTPWGQEYCVLDVREGQVGARFRGDNYYFRFPFSPSPHLNDIEIPMSERTPEEIRCGNMALVEEGLGEETPADDYEW